MTEVTKGDVETITELPEYTTIVYLNDGRFIRRDGEFETYELCSASGETINKPDLSDIEIESGHGIFNFGVHCLLPIVDGGFVVVNLETGELTEEGEETGRTFTFENANIVYGCVSGEKNISKYALVEGKWEMTDVVDIAVIPGLTTNEKEVIASIFHDHIETLFVITTGRSEPTIGYTLNTRTGEVRRIFVVPGKNRWIIDEQMITPSVFGFIAWDGSTREKIRCMYDSNAEKITTAPLNKDNKLFMPSGFPLTISNDVSEAPLEPLAVSYDGKKIHIEFINKERKTYDPNVFGEIKLKNPLLHTVFEHVQGRKYIRLMSDMSVVSHKSWPGSIYRLVEPSAPEYLKDTVEFLRRETGIDTIPRLGIDAWSYHVAHGKRDDKENEVVPSYIALIERMNNLMACEVGLL